MNARLLLGFCLVSAASPAGAARADESPYLGRENPLATLLPSAASLSTRERSRREQHIQRALLTFTQVKRADVLVAEPQEPRLDQPPSATGVSIRLEAHAGGPSDAEIRRIVSAVLPEVSSEHTHISRTGLSSVAPPETQVVLARVGPFVVAKDSSALLRATLAGCLGLNALLAGLVLARRRAR